MEKIFITVSIQGLGSSVLPRSICAELFRVLGDFNAECRSSEGRTTEEGYDMLFLATCDNE